MIIECINCNKKFNVVSDLIPAEGRLVQCGSCDHSWHYKIEKPSSKPLILDEIDNLKNKIKEKTQDDNSNNKDNDDPKKITKQDINIKKNQTDKNNIIQKEIQSSSISTFFSYLLVFIISIVALTILIDTIKSPLIDLFPGLEIILFNLFETLKDVKSFIIDLT